MAKSERKKLFINIFQKFAIFFTIVLLVLSVAGLILAQINSKEHDVSEIVTYENTGLFSINIMTPGLSYSYILILACVIFVITLIFLLVASAVKTKPRTKKTKTKYDELFKRHHVYQKKKMT